jgi:hypothetical protein
VDREPPVFDPVTEVAKRGAIPEPTCLIKILVRLKKHQIGPTRKQPLESLENSISQASAVPNMREAVHGVDDARLPRKEGSRNHPDR